MKTDTINIIKKVITAIILLIVGFVLTSYVLINFLFIPTYVLIAFQSSFFVTYVYSQYLFYSSKKKDIIINKEARLKTYLIMWIVVLVFLSLVNYLFKI